MDWKYLLLTILLLYGVSLGLYVGIRKLVLSKYKLQKRYVIIMIFALLVVQVVAAALIPGSTVTQFVITILFIVAVLVLMDLLKKEREIKNRPVVGRPKPKLKRSNGEDNSN